MLFSILFSMIVLSQCATINKKVKVPDSDPLLQDLIYRAALPNANQNAVRDEVYWVPDRPASFGATKVSVPNNGNGLYTTYSLHMTLKKSNCKVRNTPAAALKDCQPIRGSPVTMVCTTTMAWPERDWSNVEVENHCGQRK